MTASTIVSSTDQASEVVDALWSCPTTYFHILDGLKLVSLKVELPQDLLESIKLFIFHNYDLSDELMVCRFSTIFFVSHLPVSCKDVESLPLVQAFDAIFKTNKLEFEPNNA